MTAQNLEPSSPVISKEDISEQLTLFQVHDDNRHPIKVKLKVQQQVIEMEVDTGAAVSLMSTSQYNQFLPLITE